MKITTVVAMDIKTAVDYTVKEILLGASGLIVPTEFGRIPVEVVRGKPIFDMISACRWNDCPTTKFVMGIRGDDHEWYVQVRYIDGMDPILLRVQLIRELTAVMYRTLSDGGRLPEEHLVNALTREYVLSYHSSDYEVNRIRFISAYARAHGGIAVKLSHAASKVIKNEMARAFDAEETISKLGKNECMKNYRELGFRNGNFGNSFYDLIAASLMTQFEGIREKYNMVADTDEDISAYNLIKRVTK